MEVTHSFLVYCFPWHAIAISSLRVTVSCVIPKRHGTEAVSFLLAHIETQGHLHPIPKITSVSAGISKTSLLLRQTGFIRGAEITQPI